MAETWPKGLVCLSLFSSGHIKSKTGFRWTIIMFHFDFMSHMSEILACDYLDEIYFHAQPFERIGY